ncbi:hypothetical protein Fleli_2460 [Bernardetia litoralis DSM 6794]|uniref:Chromosome partition protein Smc n=1 Tax=Bernardetia litoralis (strain ATCC 23117 / DSM 6794 / NBRC 15988 / NCIMB 1366 / Fx l1 / Sio-4) TaxID=880071 RepID=I4ALJ1_BERLS|nr:hypothetical protein [Bernardetia litoralis]AFM04826.1 hypothetical protein Fleli_2460 [Bernardetia litoralis DSM 6794]
MFKSNFNNVVLCTTLFFSVLFISSCDKGPSENEKKLVMEVEDLRRAREKDSLYQADLQQEMNVIYVRLDSMRQVEDKIRKLTSDMRGGNIDPSTGGMSIDQGMQQIERQMQANRAKVAELERKLKESGQENSMMANQIASLKSDMANKDAEITQMRGRIADLEGEVEGWKSRYSGKIDELDSTNVVLEDTRTVANTAYYVVGTEKELKDKDIIINDKKGFEPDGRTKSKFTAIDIRTTNSIVIGSSSDVKVKKVKLLPSRSASSYKIEERGGKVYLEITNSEKFWESKYLAILSKTSLF